MIYKLVILSYRIWLGSISFAAKVLQWGAQLLLWIKVLGRLSVYMAVVVLAALMGQIGLLLLLLEVWVLKVFVTH